MEADSINQYVMDNSFQSLLRTILPLHSRSLFRSNTIKETPVNNFLKKIVKHCDYYRHDAYRYLTVVLNNKQSINFLLKSRQDTSQVVYAFLQRTVPRINIRPEQVNKYILKDKLKRICSRVGLRLN